MKIKKIGLKQLDSVYSLGKQEFCGEEWCTKKFLEETLKTHSYAYACFDKKEMIGCIIVKKYDRPKLWIFFFVVKTNRRRQGIGTKLLKQVEKHCNKKHPFLFVDFEKKDKIATKFYSKNGFKHAGIVQNWFGARQSGLVYCKKVV